MKSLLFSLSMIISLSSFAEVKREWDEATEKKCHKEAAAQLCLKNDVEDATCIKGKLDKMSASCKAMFQDKLDQ